MALKVDKLLDCSGLLCPLPVIRTNKAIKEVNVGQILEVWATDPGAPKDLEAWARQTGHELLESVTEGSKFIFRIRRTH